MSSQRAAGGQDIKVKGRLATVRVLASGEEWFVQASSRIVLSVCRIIVAAVPWFWWVEASQAGCGWAAHPGGDCWLPAARVLVSGEEWFVQASSRIVLSVCRLIVAAVLWFWWVAGAS